MEGIKLHIVQELLKEPGTAQQVAIRLKESEPKVWRRCSDLKGIGVLREIGKTENPTTGKKAVVLAPTEHALPWLKGEWKPPKTTVKAAKRKRAVEDATPGPPVSLDKWVGA